MVLRPLAEWLKNSAADICASYATWAEWTRLSYKNKGCLAAGGNLNVKFLELRLISTL